MTHAQERAETIQDAVEAALGRVLREGFACRDGRGDVIVVVPPDGHPEGVPGRYSRDLAREMERHHVAPASHDPAAIRVVDPDLDPDEPDAETFVRAERPRLVPPPAGYSAPLRPGAEVLVLHDRARDGRETGSMHAFEGFVEQDPSWAVVRALALLSPCRSLCRVDRLFVAAAPRKDAR